MAAQLRFGIFGLGRGGDLMGNIIASGAKIVAVCDQRDGAIENAKRIVPDCTSYHDFDAFVQHDMDVVLLANYFSEHVPYAVKAMRAGKHVLSETISNVTMAEGVELCRIKEETGKVYGLLENYPFFKSNLEMRRLYQEGTLGELVYAEGEYIHPMSPYEQTHLSPGKHHWRNWTPRTYYSTHALAPLMYMTGATPTRVNAMASFHPEIAKGTANHCGDAAAVIMCQTNTNAIFRVIGWGMFAPHGNNYRLCCTRGGVETNHTTNDIRLSYLHWAKPAGVDKEVCEYTPEWEKKELADFAEKAGHGGGDFFAVYHFVKAIENGEEPYFDVYRATAMASVAILAWRSVLNNNITYDVPDFHKKEDCLKYEHDHLCPYYRSNASPSIPCSSQSYSPCKEDMENAEKEWKDIEYAVQYQET